jgi:hypothetical protein
MCAMVIGHHDEESAEAQPTREERAAVACPVDWLRCLGFEEGFTGALDALYAEWVRCVSATCISREEASFVADLLTEIDFYEPAPKNVISNLETRHQEAVKLYMDGIGRLASLRFLRPSHDGKHFAPGGPKASGSKTRSFFYTDLEAGTVANLFWAWFNDAFALDGDPRDAVGGSLAFLRPYSGFWADLVGGPQLRVAIDTTHPPIGELDGVPLHNVALHVHIASRAVHAYPVAPDQANQIMRGKGVRVIKSREY